MCNTLSLICKTHIQYNRKPVVVSARMRSVLDMLDALGVLGVLGVFGVLGVLGVLPMLTMRI